MKILSITAKLIFVLCLPFLLLTASIGITANSLWLYQYGFQKYNISQSAGLAETELDKTARELISYYNSSEEYIDVVVIKDGQLFTLFNQREILHLKDVKSLIRLDYLVLLVTLIYAIGYALISLFCRRKRYWRQLARAVITGSGLTLALMLALGLGALLGFDRLFLAFHLLSFTNDLWLLDPSRDYLIRLFPGGFFFDAALFIVLTTVIGAVVVGGVALGFLSRRRESEVR